MLEIPESTIIAAQLNETVRGLYLFYHKILIYLNPHQQDAI